MLRTNHSVKQLSKASKGIALGHPAPTLSTNNNNNNSAVVASCAVVTVKMPSVKDEQGELVLLQDNHQTENKRHMEGFLYRSMPA